MRLCGRFRSITRKGKRPTVVAMAIARELSAFIWAINREVVGSRTSIVQKRGQDHGKGNSRAYYVADHMIDARSQTGTAPDEQTAMRYPPGGSELDHRRLQVPPSPLHDPSSNQLHAGERGERPSRTCGA